MTKIKLSKISTRAPEGLNKSKAKNEFKKLKEKFVDLQYKMAAQKKHSLLVVLQGMDASGKSGAIRNVFGTMNPSGINVHAFKKPTDLEFAHDFLWRVHQVVPKDGMIQIFDRSHYEDVLIQRVHKWITPATVKKRFQHINNFEQLIQDNGTSILKFYLHISKEKQLERLTERKTIERKFWKHNDNDWKEREMWPAYMSAYESVFENCGPDIPWTIVPSDQNWVKEYTILKKVVETMQKMKLKYPPLKTEG